MISEKWQFAISPTPKLTLLPRYANVPKRVLKALHNRVNSLDVDPWAVDSIESCPTTYNRNLWPKQRTIPEC